MNCGYVFCPKPLPRDNKASPESLRILRTATATRDLKLVSSNKFEMWCSKDCAKRAQYVRVQLSELPAWERSASANNHHSLLTLLDDDLSSVKASKVQADTPEDEKRAAMTELARERGEQTAQALLQPAIPQPGQQSSLEPFETKAFPIRERVQVTAPEPPRLDVDEPGEIEGYVPKSRPQKSSKDDDDEDTDWKFG